uniref:Uncharacterized protein n=1 Tax=Sphaerodactylus townsendi TaxID=933632 RepID=A0ACB8F5R9_9SAUR
MTKYIVTFNVELALWTFYLSILIVAIPVYQGHLCSFLNLVGKKNSSTGDIQNHGNAWGTTLSPWGGEVELRILFDHCESCWLSFTCLQIVDRFGATCKALKYL